MKKYTYDFHFVNIKLLFFDKTNTHLLVFKHLQSPAVSFLSLLLIVVVSIVASIVSNALIAYIASIVAYKVLSLLLFMPASIRLLLLNAFALLLAQRLQTYFAFKDFFERSCLKVCWKNVGMALFSRKGVPMVNKKLVSRYHLLHHQKYHQDDQYLNHLPVQLLIKNRGTKHLTPPIARQS